LEKEILAFAKEFEEGVFSIMGMYFRGLGSKGMV
jgi:hypothetical protein